jgi:hypothetical protein
LINRIRDGFSEAVFRWAQGGPLSGFAMPFPPVRIDRISSPPLPPGDDRSIPSILRRMPLGDGPVEREASHALAELDGAVTEGRAPIEAILELP